MGVKYTAWETRTVDVPGVSLGLYQEVDAKIRRKGSSDTIGASPPGSYPWRDDSLRLATADTARNRTSSTESTLTDGQENYAPGDFPGAHPRVKSFSAIVGMHSFTTADRILIGTYYDDWTFGMWLGHWYVAAGNLWLQDAHVTPDPLTANRAILSYAEWDALWAPTPAGSGWTGRQVDVLASGLEYHVTLDFDPGLAGSPTVPTLTRKERDLAHTTADWYQADLVEALPTVGTLSGAATSLTLGGAWGTGGIAPKLYGSPITGPVEEADLPGVTGTWKPAGSDPANTNGVYWEFVDYSPMWPSGVLPGYDETGGIPPPVPPSHVYTGGPGEDRYAYVRVQLTTRFTVRQRWVGWSASTPPLWQRQRIGVLDSPESYAAGLVTPQSSPWQGGTP